MATLADLLARKAALDKKIADKQRAERDGAITKIHTLMAQYGLTAADIGKAATPTHAGRMARNAPAPGQRAAARKGKALGKVAPKFRDPASGATWSGRGLKPKWLAAALAEGRPLDDFRI